VIFWFGRSVPGLTALIAGSFHWVIPPWKIFAISDGVSTSLSTPGAL
jgi:hypothetical protein